MTDLLKDLYDNEFLTVLSAHSLAVDADFDDVVFFKNTLENNWPERSLKERMRLIAIALGESLSALDYQDKIDVLKKVAINIPKAKNSGLTLIIFADFVEIFGLDAFDFSLDALKYFTEFGSAEFAIRQFIKLDSEKAMKVLKEWSLDKNYHVRRLASEGCRPNLPWGEGLGMFKKDPTAIFPILENLKSDESEYVRRSVANNMNDISKNHPQIVTDLMAQWKEQNIDPRLIKHGLRTLLKQGNKDALKLIGIDGDAVATNFNILGFNLKKDEVSISQDLFFSFELESKLPNAKTRLEYAIYFLKKNGTHNKKIFQIATKKLDQGVFKSNKKHSFKELTTRKHYVGTHMISLVVNGLEVKKLEFNLKS